MAAQYNTSLFQLHHTKTIHPQDQKFPMHTHNSYEILYCDSGRVSFLVEGSVYPMDKGSILLTRPAESHKLRVLGDQPYERSALHFRPEILDNWKDGRELLLPFLNRPIGQKNLYTPSQFSSSLVYDNFKEIIRLAQKDMLNDVLLYSYLLPVLASLREAFLSPRQESTPAEDQDALCLVQYVNEHLFEDLSLSLLCQRFHFSKSQLTRQFRNATGSTLWNYVLIKRLMHAQHLMREGTTPGKACEQCGFQDYSAFYRAYKKRFGLSPEADRKQQNQE